MNANSYLSLARNYSFVIILLTFIALQGTLNYVKDLAQIGEARQLFGNVVLGTYVWHKSEVTGREYKLEIPGTAPIRYTFFNDSYRDMFLGQGDSSLRRDLHLYYDGVPAWTSDLTVLIQDDNAAKPDPYRPKAMAQLRDSYRTTFGSSLATSGGETPVTEAETIMHKIEAFALQRRTAIPGLGLEFGNGIAPWFIAATVLGLTVQIRNQVRRTLLDPQLALSEPWLILDARRGLEKIVAAAWGATILVAPWITSGCLVAVVTAQILMNGKVVTPLREGAFDFFFACLLVFGSWSSLTTSGELLRLRRERLEKLDAIAREAGK